MLRAVLDANVFVSAWLRPEGTPGQTETLQSLAYPKVRKAARSRTDSQLWFEDILVLAEIVPGELEVRRVSADPDDDKYVAAAMEERAAFVVSGDPRLLDIGEHQGVRFVTPRAFLDLLARTGGRR